MKVEFRPSEQSPGFGITVRPWQVTRLLLGIVLVLSLLSLAGLVLVHFLAEPLGITLGDRADPSSLRSLAYFFNADDEFSVANWYSAFALLLAAGGLGVVAWIKHRRGLAYAGQWTGLAAIFVLLSIVETTVINDRLVRPSQQLFSPTSGFLSFGWVIPGMILVAIFGLAYLRFFFDLPGRTRWLFLLAGGLYVGGALGVEMLGSSTAQGAGLGSFLYELLAFFEETMEMLGVIVLVHAVLAYLQSPFLLDDSHIRLAGKGLVITRRGWVVLALLLAAAVLFDGAAVRNMRPDEAIAFDGTSDTLATTIQYQIDDVHAPAYFVAFHLWQQVAGNGEFAARVFSLLQSMLTLALVFHIGRRWFGGWWFGLAGLLAVGLSAYFFKYGLEIRPYATVMLLGTLSMLAFAAWLERRTWRSAALYGLTVALILYLHYFEVFLVLVQGLYLLGVIAAEGRAGLRRIPQAASAYLGAFMLWLPWLPIFLSQVSRVGQLVPENQTQIAGLGMAGTTYATTWPTVRAFLLLATNAVPVLVLAVLAAGGALLWRRRLYWLAAAWGIGIPLVTFLVNLIVPVYEPRYIAHLAPGLGLLIGVSLAALPVRRKAIPLAALLVIGLLTVHSAPLPPRHFRDAARQLNAAFRPGDMVYLYSLPSNLMSQYHFRQYAPVVTGALYTANGRALDPIQRWQGTPEDMPRCVWFGTADWHNDSVQAAFEALEEERPQVQVVGSHDDYLFQRLCKPPEVAPVSFGNRGDSSRITFLGADVNALTQDALELALWWTVDAAPGADYTIGAYLLDASGALAAQRDGPLTNYWSGQTVLTSALEPGRYWIDRRIISLPHNLPPGDYTLALAIYQPWDGVRLPVAGADDDLLRVMTVTIP